MGRVDKTKDAILLSLVLLVVAPTLAGAATGRAAAEHMPNEFIVKFHEPVASSLKRQLELKSLPGAISLSTALDKLNARYKVQRLTPLCKNFRERHQELSTLGKKNEALLSKKEKHILRRLRRAPKGAKAPDLGRLYKIQLDPEPTVSLREVIEAYQQNPDVEYAELNYVVSTCNALNDPLYPLQWPFLFSGR
jgi:hypothetical protein